MKTVLSAYQSQGAEPEDIIQAYHDFQSSPSDLVDELKWVMGVPKK